MLKSKMFFLNSKQAYIIIVFSLMGLTLGFIPDKILKWGTVGHHVVVMVMGWEEPFVASFLAVPMQPKQ